MRSLKHNQAHISTQDVMGKVIAEKPQLYVYYDDREHVTIILQYSSQVLSTISKNLHTN